MSVKIDFMFYTVQVFFTQYGTYNLGDKTFFKRPFYPKIFFQFHSFPWFFIPSKSEINYLKLYQNGFPFFSHKYLVTETKK